MLLDSVSKHMHIDREIARHRDRQIDAVSR